MAEIYTDREHINVNLDEVGDLLLAMRFKAMHIKAKADPTIFYSVAEQMGYRVGKPALRKVRIMHLSCGDEETEILCCPTCGSEVNTQFCGQCGQRMKR